MEERPICIGTKHPHPDRPTEMVSAGKRQWMCPVCLRYQTKEPKNRAASDRGQGRKPEEIPDRPICPNCDRGELSSNGSNWHCPKRRGGCGYSEKKSQKSS